jgi:hypothetical protein
VSSSRPRPPGTLGAYLALVLAVLVFDVVDGGLTAAALGGAALWAALALGVLWRLWAAWMALIVLHCGDVAVLIGRGDWWLAASNLALLALLIARPTRNYVRRREGTAGRR